MDAVADPGGRAQAAERETSKRHAASLLREMLMHASRRIASRLAASVVTAAAIALGAGAASPRRFAVSDIVRIGGSPWTEQGERLTREQSPITYVRRIRTPTLIIATTGDVRVPVTQSHKLFLALTDLGAETKFVGYPVGGHGPGDPVRHFGFWTRWIAWIEAHDPAPMASAK